MIQQLKVSFAGSFQSRLATDHDPTDASPTDPSGRYGRASQGWTFAYRESRFDRIIRLSSPVQLRNALIDSWVNVVVGKVEADQGNGFASVPGDPLFNKLISLGAAKFDTKAGNGGVTKEALVGVKFAIATMLTAEPASLPVLDGAKGSNKAWRAEYNSKKPQKIQSSQLDPERIKVLERKGRIDDYASFFQIRCPTKPIPMKAVQFASSVSGVLTQLESPASTKYDWSARMAFYRFDGDTLTGKMDGQLLAKLKP